MSSACSPLQNKKIYLDIIHTYMEVHATVYGSSTKNIPSYVKNHGILSGRDLQFLLRETKVKIHQECGVQVNAIGCENVIRIFHACFFSAAINSFGYFGAAVC